MSSLLETQILLQSVNPHNYPQFLRNPKKNCYLSHEIPEAKLKKKKKTKKITNHKKKKRTFVVLMRSSNISYRSSTRLTCTPNVLEKSTIKYKLQPNISIKTKRIH